jgi:hypothetical protein
MDFPTDITGNQAGVSAIAELTADELDAVAGGEKATYTVFYDTGYWIATAINWLGDVASSIGDTYAKGVEQSSGTGLAY